MKKKVLLLASMALALGQGLASVKAQQNFVGQTTGSVPPTVNLATSFPYSNCVYSGITSLALGQIIPFPCNSSGQLQSALSVSPIAYIVSTSATVNTTSGTLISAGAYTKTLTICTLPASTTNVWVNPLNGTAAVGAGLPIYAGGGCLGFGGEQLPIPTGAITAITDNTSSQTVTLAGG